MAISFLTGERSGVRSQRSNTRMLSKHLFSCFSAEEETGPRSNAEYHIDCGVSPVRILLVVYCVWCNDRKWDLGLFPAYFRDTWSLSVSSRNSAPPAAMKPSPPRFFLSTSATATALFYIGIHTHTHTQGHATHSRARSSRGCVVASAWLRFVPSAGCGHLASATVA